MKDSIRVIKFLLAATLVTLLPFFSEAKSYSSGGKSYSSHSSSSHSSGSSHSSSSSTHSSGGGGSHSSSPSSSKSFSSGGGKSYSSHSSSSDSAGHGYSSGKSYSSGGSKTYTPRPSPVSTPPKSDPPKRSQPASAPSSFSYDTAAARAKKEETSKQEFTKYKEAQNPRPAAPAETPRTVSDNSSYRTQTPPIPSSGSGYRQTVYVPDSYTIWSRPQRSRSFFEPYYYRPMVIYHDHYSSFFWWWLLDRSLDDRAWWAYHHRYDMDPDRYAALVATDQQLQTRVAELEAQQAQRDPAYAPAGLDRDLMYSDQYVQRNYSNRRTTGGVIGFWLFAVPTAIGVCVFFIWLIWFKRWQTAAT